MTPNAGNQSEHQHNEATLHLLTQRDGVPYEVEQKICTECERVLDERLLKRAAA